MKKILLATTLLISSGFIFANEQGHAHEAEHSHNKMSMDNMEPESRGSNNEEELKKDIKQHEHKSHHSPIKSQDQGVVDDDTSEKIEQIKEKTHDHMKMK